MPMLARCRFQNLGIERVPEVQKNRKGKKKGRKVVVAIARRDATTGQTDVSPLMLPI